MGVTIAKIDGCVDLLGGDFARPVIRLSNVYVEKDKRNKSKFFLFLRKGKRNKSKFFRREPVLVRNLDNGSWTIALCLGAGGTKGVTKTSVGIEYDTADILGVKFHTKEPLNLSIERAPLWRKVYWYLNHPDHGVRTSMWFGITGLISFADSMLNRLFDLIEALIKYGM